MPTASEADRIAFVKGHRFFTYSTVPSASKSACSYELTVFAEKYLAPSTTQKQLRYPSAIKRNLVDWSEISRTYKDINTNAK